jgi:hypothetical protein
VASGVWSGVGEVESCENVGEGGAVEYGELGRDFFVMRWLYGSSASCECERDIGCECDESEYWARPGIRAPWPGRLYGWARCWWWL